jgi:hypothetical protein
MLHQFYQNRSNKLILRGVLYTPLIFFILISNSFAQGLYSDFSKSISEQKEKYSNFLKKYSNSNFELSEILDFQQVRLNQKYLMYILAHSPIRYTQLAASDRCSLYDLLNTDLLFSPSGKVDQVLIDFLDSEKRVQTKLVSKRVFLNQVVAKQCPKLKEFSQHFNLANLRRTLNNIKIEIPKSEQACIKDIYRFKKDVKSPYLCQIYESVKSQRQNEIKYKNMSTTVQRRNQQLKDKIDNAKAYKKILTKPGLEIVSGYCQNLAYPLLYCKNYFRKSLWTNLNKKNPKASFFETYCSGKNRKECLRELNTESSSCHYKGDNYTGLYPKPNCNSLSNGLLKSRLFSDYKDCPAIIKNEAMIGFSRILNHVSSTDINKKHSCNLNIIYPFAKFNQDFLDFNSWQTQICYNDILIGNDKICIPTIFGEVENSPLSITSVIQKITYRLKGNNNTCKIINKKDYNPALLEFKAGCYIINDFRKCSGEDCDFNVLLDGKPFDQFTVDYKLQFDLFPISYVAENKSLRSQFIKNKKKTFKTVKNTTILKNILGKDPKTIVFGMGCIEELLPSFFKRRGLNQCRPTSFIIDSIVEEEGIFAVHIRTSLDHIHAPRTIPWSRVFNSVRNYQNIHPLRSWELYAIY